MRAIHYLVLGFSLLAITAATAKEPIHFGNLDDLESITVRLENDAPGGTDSWYTAGNEIALTFEPWTNRDHPSQSYNSSLTLGQFVFTPRNVRTSEIVKDDRPYAGWSYLTYNFHRAAENSSDSLGLTLGIVGPGSGAESLQRGLHELIDDHFPEGWKNQLHNELGIALVHKHSNRLGTLEFGDELALDFVERGAASIGNIDTSISEGFLIRFGRNLPNRLSPDRIGAAPPRMNRSETMVHHIGFKQPARFYWMLGAKASYVVRNIFLDGNSSGRSHSVEKKNVVAETEFGFAYAKPSFRFSVLYVYRTPEFEAQDGGQGFASLSFTFRR